MPARLIAYHILNDVFFQKKSLDEAYIRVDGFDDLEGRDKGLVRHLVSTVLKRKNEMDNVLKGLLHEPIEELKPPQLMNVFRIGMAQLIFLQTPSHAAVSTTVDLAEQAGVAHQKPLVNAIMRRLTNTHFPKKDERQAGRTNTPEWLWNIWMNDYGVEVALDISAANLSESPVDFTVKNDPKTWEKRLEAMLLPTGSLRKETAGFVPGLDGFHEGSWWVQNAAAAMPVKFISDLKNKTGVDMCAAPGGKTAQLASQGARVIALDRSPKRMSRLEENMTRLGFDNIETVVADAAVWQPKEKVDFVLLDAPCTATGTIRHQPDVLYLKDIRDQEKLSALQKRLMLNAVDMLKTGGVLIYCTCSIQKDEGENQTNWLLEQGLPIRLDPIKKNELDGIQEMLTDKGEIRALPHHWKKFNGIDGFYVARFAKI